MDETDVANRYADKLSAVYCDSSADVDAVSEYSDLYAACTAENILSESSFQGVSVEMIDSCIRGLNHGKACGPDNLLSAEHIQYAHPSVVVHLKLLFHLIISHGYVPDKFGSGLIVPLVKDRAADPNDMDNYHGIPLVPILSKVFESLILSVCRDVLHTDPLQFGFTSGVGCSEAIFALKSTINHFI